MSETAFWNGLIFGSLWANSMWFIIYLAGGISFT